MIAVHKLDRDHLKHENGLDAQRLLPWTSLNAPFEGSWCVIRAGTASTPHAHEEYEIFIATSGRAAIVCQSERFDFVEGDIVHFPPHTPHQVVNDSSRDFQMYSIWWDTEMSVRFQARHEHGV
jgi:mannose-6-phosphate isomerase-like protein (cupin superfamily)